jgi:ribosomal protein S18 acetylase RimI-like enzyme
MEGKVILPDAPQLPGLVFRHFRGESDYPYMAALIAACKTVDGVERSTSVEDIATNYRHLENCDPARDMLFAEVDGQVIAYGRLFWDLELDGTRIYHIIGYLHPQWRHQGIGTALWKAGERRMNEIDAGAPKDKPRYIQCEPFESEKDWIALLESQGCLPARYETHMVRDLSEPFPEAPMPAGLEVRPVRPEDIWPVFHASNEAFRDHWGAHDESEEQHKAFLESPFFRPELWKVAWDGSQMASVVHNFVDEKENAEYRRKRGYTEGICTRRPWRHKGLARSLLVQSMQMFKAMGMTETALSVDSENLSGALRLYESVGYRKVKQQIIYRKPLG